MDRLLPVTRIWARTKPEDKTKGRGSVVGRRMSSTAMQRRDKEERLRLKVRAPL